MASAYGRLGGISVLVMAAIMGLGACSSGSGSPKVASLGGSGGASSGSGSTATPQPTGNPTQLLDEWGSCMRSHGYPTLSDPTVDANKVIHIVIPPGITGNVTQQYANSKAYAPCNPYLTAASTALRGGQPPQRPDPAKLEKFSRCMRANGIPDFPDATGNGFQIKASPGSDLNPNSPIFKNAQKKCATQVGVPQLAGGNPQPGGVEIQQQGGGAAGSNG